MCSKQRQLTNTPSSTIVDGHIRTNVYYRLRTAPFVTFRPMTIIGEEKARRIRNGGIACVLVKPQTSRFPNILQLKSPAIFLRTTIICSTLLPFHEAQHTECANTWHEENIPGCGQLAEVHPKHYCKENL